MLERHPITGTFFSPYTEEERFWPKVNKHGPIPEYAPHLGACWIWIAGLTNAGYGQFKSRSTILAHRFSYELEKGKIPEGLEIDHLCRVRHCVRPSHLEAVTEQINQLRGKGISAFFAAKTHCPRGHEYSGRNCQKSRICNICNAEAAKRYYHEKHPNSKFYRAKLTG